jgi:hypothetical protein
MARLMNDEPILFDACDVGLPHQAIAIVGGRDETAIRIQLQNGPDMAGRLEFGTNGDGQLPKPAVDQVAAAVVAVREKFPELGLRAAEKLVQVAVDAAWQPRRSGA